MAGLWIQKGGHRLEVGEDDFPVFYEPEGWEVIDPQPKAAKPARAKKSAEAGD